MKISSFRPAFVAIGFAFVSVFSIAASESFAASKPKLPAGSVVVTSTNSADFLALGRSGKNKVSCRINGTKDGLLAVGFVAKNPTLKKNVWRGISAFIKDVKKNKSLTSETRKKQLKPLQKAQDKFLLLCQDLTATPTPEPTSTPTTVPTVEATPTSPGDPTATPTPTVTPTNTPTNTPTSTPTQIPAPDALARINSGGPQKIDSLGRTWERDDVDASDPGGENSYVFTPSDRSLTEQQITIDLINNPGTVDYQYLYQTDRFGQNLQFDLLIDPGTYDVVFHFAEYADTVTQVGQRRFNVAMEGNIVLPDFDILAEAGAKFKAIARTIPVTVLDNSLQITFTALSGDAKISGIEVLGPGGVEYRLNCGANGIEEMGWSDETFYVLGTSGVGSTVAPIDMSGITEPALQGQGVMFQTERWGHQFQYAIPRAPATIPSGSYGVKLGFAETFHDEPGRRVFDVLLEGNDVLPDYDIFAEQGAKNKATLKTFQVNVSDGRLNIDFVASVDKGKVSVVSVAPLNLSVAPSFIDFGTQAVSTSSAPTLVLVTNHATVPVAISAIAVAGAEFTPGGDGPQTLAVGQSMSMTVTFSPTTPGGKTAQLQITTDDNSVAGGVYKVELRGTGN